MAYDAPDQLTDGTLMQATRWNQDVVNNTIFLHSPPGALFRDTSSNQLITADEPALVAFGTVGTYDTDSMADTSASVTQFSINTAGVYFVTASVTLYGMTSSGMARFYLLGGNGFVIASMSLQTFATVLPVYLSVSGYYKFSAGHNISVYVSHNFTGSVRIYGSASGQHSPIFGAQWICSGEATP